MMGDIEDLVDSFVDTIARGRVGTGYVESYVAFLDVLGMRDLVARPYLDLRKMFDVIEGGIAMYAVVKIADDKMEQLLTPGSVVVTIMSDSIVISIPADQQNALSKIVGMSSFFINRLASSLEFPVFLRGGITKGEIYHEPGQVFGPALVDAHDLEDKQAVNMRCIAGPKITADESWKDVEATFDVDSHDGLPFIRLARPAHMDRMREYAKEILSSGKPSTVKEKYRWLLRYLEDYEFN